MRVRDVAALDVVVVESNVLASDSYTYACCHALFEAAGWWDRALMSAQQMCSTELVVEAACERLRERGDDAVAAGVEFFSWRRVVVEQSEIHGGPTDLPRRAVGDARWVLCGPDADVGRLAEQWAAAPGDGDSVGVREERCCPPRVALGAEALPAPATRLLDAPPTAAERRRCAASRSDEDAVLQCTAGVRHGPAPQSEEQVRAAIGARAGHRRARCARAPRATRRRPPRSSPPRARRLRRTRPACAATPTTWSARARSR